MTAHHAYSLAAYPKEISLRDGTPAVLKPMTREDSGPLLDFFSRVPAKDRHYLKEDVTSPRVIRRWAKELDYERVLPLLAWVDGRVVADATLHRSRARVRRHVGELRIVVDPEYRNRGLGTTLMQELAGIAVANGLELLVFEVVAEKEAAAIKAAQWVGFVQTTLLADRVRDMEGNLRDLVVMEMPLGEWSDWQSF